MSHHKEFLFIILSTVLLFYPFSFSSLFSFDVFVFRWLKKGAESVLKQQSHAHTVST